MSERDLFANFERMRREMDELFGDVFDRGMAPVRRGGFSPAVDVYYTGNPPRAIVRADLAGVDPAGISLEIRGRELILTGRREPETGEDRAYQQLEIEHVAEQLVHLAPHPLEVREQVPLLRHCADANQRRCL